MRDPYSVLGVSRSADADAVRRAYKRLAVQFHPDRNSDPDAVGRFKEVAEAYAVLTDERERKRYARRRHREHAEREEHRRQAEEAARRKEAAQRSEAASAAEQAFWAYARQVQQRRAGERSQQRRSANAESNSRQAVVDRWWDYLGTAAAVVLMSVYLWRASLSQPLQPWLSGANFQSHALTSPIWITLSLSLLMIVRPRLFLVPWLVDKVRDVRLAGWTMLLLFPFMSAAGPFYFLIGALTDTLR